MEGIPCSGQIGGSMDRGSIILCWIYLVQSHQGQGNRLSRMLSLIRDGSEIFEGLYLWLSWGNSLAFGTSSQTSCCTQILRILMCGNSPPQRSIQQNLPMSPCSSEPLLSGLGKEFGKVGPQINANSSCGWLQITDVGQLTASLEEIFHIQNVAHCVTKLRKR